jgi:methyl-accepting chemotaxis protein
MKSVKAKLFTGFISVIFIILVLLSILSIKLFSFNQEKELLEQIDDTLDKVITFIRNNTDSEVININKNIELKKQFLIIIKDEKVIFSSETNYKTDLILEEAYDEDRYEDEDDEHHEHKKARKSKTEDRFIVYYDLLEKNDSSYEVLTGIDEELLDFHIDDIVYGIILLNITIFFILLVLGYFLINKTIKPLKLILEELQELQNSKDLSKRLKEIQSKDEFEQVVNSFNSLLNNIENSVENIKQFSSDASHELKTPLTVIQGEIELLKNKDVSKEDLYKVIKKVDFEQKNYKLL